MADNSQNNKPPRRRARTKRVMPRPQQPNPQTPNPQPNPQPGVQLKGGARTKTRTRRKPNLVFSKAYWDSHPNIRLTHRALVEFRYRESMLSGPLGENRKTPPPAKPLCRNVEEFARRGGPDLTDLIDYPHNANWKNYDPPKPKPASFYDLNVQGYLNHHGVEQRLPPANWPRNFQALQQMMRKERSDMDGITHKTQDLFIKPREPSKTNQEFLPDVYLTLFGDYGREIMGSRRVEGRRFTNFAPLAPHMIMARPDVADGIRPEGSEGQRVMDDLEDLIVPFVISDDNSNDEDENRIAGPNFFLYNRFKQADRFAGTCAALHCGALGARAMHELQCYRKAKSYDLMAYSFVAVLLTEHMTIYAIHPIQSQAPDRERDYQMTQIHSFRFDDLDVFKDGIAAFRNIREHARFWRERFMVEAEGNPGDNESDDSGDRGGSGGNGGSDNDNPNSNDQGDGSSDRGGSGDSTGQGTSSSSKRESDPSQEPSRPPKQAKLRLWIR
ncbi:hypothetical protein BO78DRAFT_413920 [Aspergillus sclerotiicarbonarius CBS 121057]|uniref:Uncharacterized protein n=1 Tax=Aspergillus sclerotiicarbonarius (strain CBS 121057 / IBT 28362) TaxID=1448318 RepID=A0A319EM73_ASPSB|nr:hypothetical protein BO78DRAFT_413920 [Aspergillus sclerotiicarbonarius CBS 121057]